MMDISSLPEDLVDEVKMYVKMKFRKAKCEFSSKLGDEIFDEVDDHELYEDSMADLVKKYIAEQWEIKAAAKRQREAKNIIDSGANFIPSDTHHQEQIASLKETVKNMTTLQEGLLAKFAALSDNVNTLLEQKKS